MRHRKRLILYIECLNKELWNEQIQLNKHKRYFFALFHNNLLVISTILLPALVGGWHSGHIAGHIEKIKKVAKFVALTFISHIRKI